MKNIKIAAKVTFQDIAIIAGFLLLSCGIENLSSKFGDTASFIIYLVTWPILFLLFFYSNAELFKSINNSYLWSLSTGIPSIILTTGSIMYVTHNVCKIPFVG